MMMIMMMIPTVAGELTASARRYPMSSDDMLTNSSNTIHVTPSIQGGVVSDPDNHDNDDKSSDDDDDDDDDDTIVSVVIPTTGKKSVRFNVHSAVIYNDSSPC